MTQPHPTCNTTKMGSFGSSSESQPQPQPQPQAQPQPLPHQLLTVGAEVEVSSDEEGFKGSWYIATVLESSISKKHKKARVEYKTLLTEDGSEQLKEDVDLSYVRPLPPKDDVANTKDFVEGEIVGAYCRDGWWTGVVKKALGKSKYRVFFENPPDVIEFEVKDLRVHLEWLEGKWVRPTKQKKAESIFSSGTDVEVNIKKENLRDAWFPAIVIKENEDDTFIVKCQSSRNGDEAGLEKITVDLLHIRPRPPHPPVNKRYDVLEKVDAFWDFAWRPGVIVKLFTDTRYLVFFKLANENKIINQSEIRPHVEWKDGKWDRGLEEVLPASDVQERSGHAQNNTGNLVITTQIESSGVAKDKIETRTPLSTNSVKNLMEQHPNEGKEVTPTLTPSMKTIKFRVPTPNGDATRTHPSKKLKTENAAEAPLSITASQSRKTPSKVSMKVLSGMATPSSGGKGSKLSGVIGNQPSAKTEGLVRQRKAWTKQRELGKLDNQRTNPVNTKRRYTKTPVKDPLTSASGKKGNASGGTAKESDQGTAKESDQAGVKKAGIPFILGLEAKEMGGLVSGNPRQLSKKKNTNHSTKDKGIMEIDQQKSGGSSNKRKRGRPRKLVITSSEASLGGQEQNGVGGAANETDVKDHLTQEVASDMVTGEQSTDSHDTSRKKLAEVSGTNCTSNDAVKTRVDNTDDDDRPLSAWFGMQSPPNVNEPRPLSAGTADERSEEREGPVGGTADKLSEARGQVDTAQKVPATVDTEQQVPTTADTEQQVPATFDTEQQVPATDTTGDSALDENRSLPFVKSSALWKTIESMEIFKALPQNPHFRPLVKCTEAYREGLAIGNMVTFSSLVEKISKLQFGDPRSIFDSYLEGLRDLEKQGFDVTLLRSRINEMISFKDREAQILNESKDAEGKILHFDREKAEMAEEMANISKKIIELQEKRASIESEMENKKREIAGLQMHADAIKEDIQSNRINFEKLAAAPWKSG